MRNIKSKAISSAMAVVLALGMAPSFALAAPAENATGGGGSQELAAASMEMGAQTEVPAAFDYDGDAVNFIGADGGQFGMFGADEGTTISYADGKVKIHYVISSTRGTYSKGVYLEASIEDAATRDEAKHVDFDETGRILEFELDASYCGKAWPIVPVKAAAGGSSGTDTSASQYYLAIPALEKLAGYSVDLDVTNNYRMFTTSSATLENVESAVPGASEKVLNLVMSSGSYTRAFVGTPAEAAEAESGVVELGEGNTFAFKMQWPEKGSMISKWTDGEPFVASFWSEKNEKWYGRQLTLDAKAATLVTDSWVDPAPAKSVDELIAKIQVQVRTDTTDADCAAAKEAWDALSDDEKALVQEYDYFGLDTGDASKDDPLNQDGISENEILVVSFGTSFNDSRVATIGGVEKALQAANPDWSVRRAFTAQIIINHIQARDGEKIDNMQQALDRAVANGVKNLVIAPTHLMHGAEYDELVEALDVYKSQMNITIAEPLLGQVGADGTVVNADKEAVAKAVVAAAAQNANYADAAAAATDGAAIVLMGHGTAHEAAVTYEQMQTQMDQLGYTNVFVGTVEGEPASTECQAVIQKVKDAGYKKVFLRPLMVVAGDHANNDMADAEDPESWVSQFTAAEAFDSVQCQIAGLGEIEAIQQIYVDHVKAALEGASAAATVAEQIAALTENSTAEDVKAARDAYDALSDAQKALVDEEPLLKAEKALADAAAAAAAEAAAADDATLEQKLAAAEAKAAAAEAAQKVAAAAQAKAEQAKNWAEKSQQDAQKEAKAAKAAAEAAQAEADAAKSAAETAKAEADAAKAAAETAQTEAETQKAAAEQAQAAQAKAEGEAKAAKDAQAKAEKATASAMQKNTISVQAKQVKAKAKKKTTVAAKKAFTVTNAKGKVSYYKIGGNDKKNNVTVKANGKIVVKKGLKKGKTVKVKVLVVDSGNANYTPSTAIVTLKIKVTK